MKKTDAIQLVVIIFALMSAYHCIILIPQFLFYIISWFSEGLSGGSMMETFIITILFVALYSIITIYGIRYSGDIAAAISKRAFAGEAPSIHLNVKEVLFVAFAGIAIYGLIENVPDLLVGLYSYFKSENKGVIEFNSPRPTNQSIFLMLFRSCLYFLLLVYANVFADILSRRLQGNVLDNPDEVADIGNSNNN